MTLEEQGKTRTAWDRIAPGKLSPLDPSMQRLGRAAQLACDRHDRRRARATLALAAENHAYGALQYFLRIRRGSRGQGQ
jgi:hypothetical protein